MKKYIGYLIIGMVMIFPPVMIFLNDGLVGLLIAYGSGVFFIGLFTLGILLISPIKNQRIYEMNKFKCRKK